MKVRIEFEHEDGEDPEAPFDVVELTTAPATGVDAWADAIIDILGAASWHQELVLLSALINYWPDFSNGTSWYRQNKEALITLGKELQSFAESLETLKN